MGEARDFRLNRGFTLAIRTLEGEVIGLSVAGEHMEVSPEVRSLMLLLGSYAIARAIAIRDEMNRAPVLLTSKERETLQWAAAGKSRWETGVLMRISEHGADKHLRSVRVKLGTSTTSFAVAEALRRKIID